MVIVYNPPNGTKIENFIHGDEGKLEPHLPGEVKQYSPAVATVLLDRFGFLQNVSPEEAKEIVSKGASPKEAGSVKCSYCDFVAKSEFGLGAHTRNRHKDEVAQEQAPAVDPDIIPIATAEPVTPNKSLSEVRGDDLQGSDWYGPGLTEERK